MRNLLLVMSGLVALSATACSFDYDFDQTTVLVVSQPGLAIATASTNIDAAMVKTFVDGLSKFGDVENLSVEQAMITVTNAGASFDGIEYLAVTLSNAGKVSRTEVFNLSGTNCGFTVSGSDLLHFYNNPPFSVAIELHRDPAAPDFPSVYKLRLRGKMTVKALFKP